MHRREFLWTGLSATAIAANAAGEASAALANAPPRSPLRFMPHRGQFPRHTGDSLEAEFEFLAARGFTAIEDRRLAKRAPAEQERFGSLAAAFRFDVGPFIATEDYRCATFASPSRSARHSVLSDIGAAMEIAARTGARSCLLVLGRRDPSLMPPSQLAHARALLEQCLAATESLGLTLLLEPTPIPAARAPMLIETLRDAVRLCRLLDHPRCQAVCDVHDWFSTDPRHSLSTLMEFVRTHQSHVGHVALADFPGRKEPGSGGIAFSQLFESLSSTGCGGLLSMDHGASHPGAVGEERVLRAYRSWLNPPPHEERTPSSAQERTG